MFGPKSPQILLLAELSRGWVRTGPHRPGVTIGVGIGGFVNMGLGKEWGPSGTAPSLLPLATALPASPSSAVYSCPVPLLPSSVPFPCAGTRIHAGAGSGSASSWKHQSYQRLVPWVVPAQVWLDRCCGASTPPAPSSSLCPQGISSM